MENMTAVNYYSSAKGHWWCLVLLGKALVYIYGITFLLNNFERTKCDVRRVESSLRSCNAATSAEAIISNTHSYMKIVWKRRIQNSSKNEK